MTKLKDRYLLSTYMPSSYKRISGDLKRESGKQDNDKHDRMSQVDQFSYSIYSTLVIYSANLFPRCGKFKKRNN